MLCFVQRFGSSLNLNPHFHILAIDGAFEKKTTNRQKFYVAEAPSDENIVELLSGIMKKIYKYLIKKGYLSEVDGDIFQETTDGLFISDADEDVHLPAMTASVSSKIAFGINAGHSVMRLKDGMGRIWPSDCGGEIIGEKCAAVNGFTLHANTAIKAHQRDRLEKLISYMSRGALSDDRIEITQHGKIQIKLKTSWRDGTTHVEFSPNEFIEKLIAIIPPPWFNLTRYFGIISSHAKDRIAVVPPKATTEDSEPVDTNEQKKVGKKKSRSKKRMSWAALLKRFFKIDVLICGKCQGKLKIVDVMFPGGLLTTTLQALGLPTTAPVASPAKTYFSVFDD